MDPNTKEPINSGGAIVGDQLKSAIPGTGSIASPFTDSSDMSNLENVVKNVAAQAQQDQFTSQFGNSAQPSVVETPVVAPVADPFAQMSPDINPVPAAETVVSQPDEVKTDTHASLNPDIKTVTDLLAKGPQVGDTLPTAEATPKAETPEERFIQNVSEYFDKYLKEAEEARTKKEESVVA